MLILLIDLALRFRLQRPVVLGKHGGVGMVLVELPQRVADGFGAAAGLPGQPLGDFGGSAAGAGEPPGPLDDRRPLFVGQLAELRAAMHPLLVVLDETIDGALQEADPLAAVDHEPPADQAVAPPAGNGLGRDVELLGQRFHRQHPLARRVGRHAGRIGNVLDEQPQVVAGLLPGKFQIGVGLGPEVGDPVADVLVGVGPRRVQLSPAASRPASPARSSSRGRESHLLIAKLPDGRIQIVGMHGFFLHVRLQHRSV